MGGNHLGQHPSSLKRLCVVVGKGEDLAIFSDVLRGKVMQCSFLKSWKDWKYGNASSEMATSFSLSL